MFRRLFVRWGNRNLQREVETLRKQLAERDADNDSLRREMRVREAEIETLAAVIARDRERIKSEAAAYAKQTVANEK